MSDTCVSLSVQEEAHVGITIFIGPAGSGKTERARMCAIDAAARGKRVSFLVPATPDVPRSRREIAGRAPVGVSIETVDAMVERLWGRLGDGRAIATPAHRVGIMANIVNSRQAADSMLPLQAPGLPRLLVTLAQRVAEHPGRTVGGVSPAHTAGEMLAIVGIYEHALQKAGLIERAEAYRRVTDAVTAEDVPDVVVLARATDLTPVQERFVTTIGRLTEVVVCLTFDPAAPATSSARGLVERLGAEGEVIPLKAEADSAVAAELAIIRASLGALPERPAAARGHVILSEAWGLEGECSRIACEVKDAVAAGIEPESIAIVFRDPSRRFASLAAALADAGIAAEWDVRLPLGHTGLGRVLLTALAAYGGDGRALPAALRSPYTPPSSGLVDAFDAAVRRGEVDSWARSVRWWSEHDPATARFLNQVRAVADGIRAPGSEERWHRLLSGMMHRAHGGRASVDPDVLADAGASREVLEAIGAFAAVGDGPHGRHALSHMLSGVTIALSARERPGHVQVMAAERVRGRLFSCVIVGGLNAGEFPGAAREDALSAPEVLGALLNAGIDTRPRDGLDSDRLMFYQVVTRAVTRLVLSYRSHDSDGQPLGRSIFVDEVLDLYLPPEAEHRLPEGMPRNVLQQEDLSGGRLPKVRRRVCPPGPTLGPDARTACASREVFSATEIERYILCPYLWFISGLHGARELDRVLDGAALGGLAHEVMRRFYAEFSKRTGADRVVPDALTAARSLHSEVTADAAARVRTTCAADEAALRGVTAGTWRMIESDATFLPGTVPAHHEWEFGLTDPGEPEWFDDFAVRGRVDRIDHDGENLVVTDYKRRTVGSSESHAKFGERGLVQLPLYAAAASRRLGLGVAGMLYRSFAGGRPRGAIQHAYGGAGFSRTDVVDTDAIDAAIAVALESARSAVAGIRSGLIEPHPPAHGCPTFCPARTFCDEWRPARHGPR